VQRRITAECERRVAPKVGHYRQVQDETLDALQAEIQQILETATNPEIRMKAADRLVRVMERRA
jgi:hypothetical protein